MENKKDKITVSLMVLFILFWFYIFFFIGPERFVESIEQKYLTVFLLGILGAFTSLTTFSTYPALVTFVVSGMNPLWISILAGFGLVVGDIFFFVFGKKLSRLISKNRIEKIKGLLDLNSKWVPYIIYFYVAFTPLPNNALTAFLALREYPLKRLIIPLALGDLTLPFIATYSAKFGMKLF